MVGIIWRVRYRLLRHRVRRERRARLLWSILNQVKGEKEDESDANRIQGVGFQSQR